MKGNIENYAKNLLWIVPALIAFFMALLPTLKYQWPLTADIFYHIHVAHVYSQYGLTLTDPFIDPGQGHKIAYMPLFALVIAFLGNHLNLNYINVARALQPVLAFSVVLSVSYVARKFYGDVAGISTGFLVMSSYLFTRIISPLPETMALIFIPLTIYFYYKSVEGKKHLYAVLSGLLFLIVLATHQGATLALFLVMTAVAVVMMVSRRKLRYFTGYILFLGVIACFGLLIVFILNKIMPGLVPAILTWGLTAVTGLMTSLLSNDPISNLKYIAYIGVSLIFAVIGGVVALKKRRDQDIIIFTWIITTFLISKAYWFGFNVLSIRLLVYLLLPFSILGGLGLSYLYSDFKKKEFPSLEVRSGFLVAISAILMLFAFTTVEDPDLGLIPNYDTAPGQYGIKAPQIAPPTQSDNELAAWFEKNGNNSSIMVSNNYFTNQFILAVTGQPIGSSPSFASYNKAFNESIGYIVFDKRLTFNSETKAKTTSMGSFMFVNKKYGINSLIPKNTTLVYENENYEVFKVIKS